MGGAESLVSDPVSVCNSTTRPHGEEEGKQKQGEKNGEMISKDNVALTLRKNSEGRGGCIIEKFGKEPLSLQKHPSSSYPFHHLPKPNGLEKGSRQKLGRIDAGTHKKTP